MPLVSTTEPSDGQNATAATVNTPFNAILAVLNGNIDYANLADGGITNAKLAGGIDVSKLAANTLTGWTPLGQAITYGANNGAKEFTVTAAADLTGVLSPGMRFKTTRSVVPPTQCMSFTSASSQYATHASPSGITFTGPFSCEAWIKLSSYTTHSQYIVNIFNATGSTGGWLFFIDSAGTVNVQYGSTSTFTSFNSAQAIPLNTWVHVAAVVTSVSGKTGQIYINGAAVTTLNPNTASTTLVQDSVDLRLGAAASTPANTYFNGEMSEVRVWSTNITQSQIQSNMAINLVGSETNLVALFKGNGAWTDGTSNANTLTPSGGAVNNTVDNPYNLVEYANILAVSYSNPTSTITLKTGPAGAIPNASLTLPFYSVVDKPFGFPVALRRLIYAYSQICGDFTSTSTSTSVDVSGLSVTLTIPVGGARIKLHTFAARAVSSAANNVGVQIFEGSVQLSEGDQSTGANVNNQATAEAVIYPSAGTHTYKVSIIQGSNAGTMRMGAATYTPAFIEVTED